MRQQQCNLFQTVLLTAVLLQEQSWICVLTAGKTRLLPGFQQQAGTSGAHLEQCWHRWCLLATESQATEELSLQSAHKSSTHKPCRLEQSIASSCSNAHLISQSAVHLNLLRLFVYLCLVPMLHQCGLCMPL